MQLGQLAQALGSASDQRSEPGWRSCEGSSEWLWVTSEFAKLGKGGLKVFDLGTHAPRVLATAPSRSRTSLYLFSIQIASSDFCFCSLLPAPCSSLPISELPAPP